jgi:hypothetical protein
MNNTDDIEFKPCYDSSECNGIYNCGGASGAFSCPTASSGKKNCPTGLNEGICWGNDPNYCSGIFKTCDFNKYNCSNETNPAYNSIGQLLGCNADGENCLEFKRSNDYGCSEDCWELGGRREVHNKCKNFDKPTCDAFDYFCSWNGRSCEAVNLSPNKNFKIKYGFDPPKLYSINIQSSDQCEDTDYLCKTVSVPNRETWTLNCSQSSSNSKKVTSYDTSDHICCLNKGNQKICINTPKCQFVSTTCECGLKNIGESKPVYLCAANYNSGASGYCTWCKGHHVESSNKEWMNEDGTCNNRCTNYNECEVIDSEIQWNRCIWTESNGLVGVDPNIAINRELIQKNGLCTNTRLTNDEKQNIINSCEIQLMDKIVSQNKNDVHDPFIGPVSKGTKVGYWNHICNNNRSYNYACTWCKSLQSTINNSSGFNYNIPTSAKVIISVIGCILFFIFISFLVLVFNK